MSSVGGGGRVVALQGGPSVIGNKGKERGVQMSPIHWAQAQVFETNRLEEAGVSCPNQREGEDCWAGSQNSR